MIPAQADLPLDIAAPKPTFVNGGSSKSPFGFKPNPVKNQGHSKMSKVVRHTSEEDDVVPDSETSIIGLVTILLFSFLYSNSHIREHRRCGGLRSQTGWRHT
jgi:hypothetical protein